MRTTGFILVWLGFIWLLHGTFLNPGPLERGVIYHRYDIMPRDRETFSREDFEREIRETAHDALAPIRLLIFPSMMMLLGAYLIGAKSISRRRTTSNQTLEPTPGRRENSLQ